MTLTLVLLKVYFCICSFTLKCIFIKAIFHPESYLYKGRRKLLLRAQANTHFMQTPREAGWHHRRSFARACSIRASAAYWGSTSQVAQERFWFFGLCENNFNLSSSIFCMSYEKCIVLLRFWKTEQLWF